MPPGDIGHQRLRIAVVHVPATDIIASAECSPGASEDHHTNGIVHLGLRQNLDKIPLHWLRCSVQPFRAVEGDHRDAGGMDFHLETAELTRLHCLSPLCESCKSTSTASMPSMLPGSFVVSTCAALSS